MMVIPMTDCIRGWLMMVIPMTDCIRGWLMMVIPMPDRLYQRVAHDDDTSDRQTVSEGGS